MKLGLGILAIWCAALAAEDLPAGALTVAETKVPVFEGFDSGAPRSTEALANFRLHIEYRGLAGRGRLALTLTPLRTIELPLDPQGGWRTLELQYEQLPGRAPEFSAHAGGVVLADRERLDPAFALAGRDRIALDRDFTLAVEFASTGDGALFSFCDPGEWQPGGKMLALREGSMIYDIGWVGTLTSRMDNLSDGQPHRAVLRSEAGNVALFIDGAAAGEKRGFQSPASPQHAFHIGLGAHGYVGDLAKGSVAGFRYWDRALSGAELDTLVAAGDSGFPPPRVAWKAPEPRATFPHGLAGLPTSLGFQAAGDIRIRNAWVQPLDHGDHAAILTAWNGESRARGKKIYEQVCLTCHSSLTQEGSLPTSRRFQRDAFRNGADPYRMYQSITRGFGQMPPFPQFSVAETYDVIHYIRGEFLEPYNPGGLFAITDDYLSDLPRGVHEEIDPAAESLREPYEEMDFGPALSATYEVAPGNMAHKGIATLLTRGKGGVTKGHAWAVYDHDTMRLAAVTSGTFVDWHNIAFDGTHGSHFRMTGDKLFVNPPGPGWANPDDGSWDDPRIRGADDQPCGPLPREWFTYRGMYLHGPHSVQSYRIGEAGILEAAEWQGEGQGGRFLRTLNIGPSRKTLKLRLIPENVTLTVEIRGAKLPPLTVEQGMRVLTIPPHTKTLRFRIAIAPTESPPTDLSAVARLPMDLGTLTRGGARRWAETLTTRALAGIDDAPFVTDILTHPDGTDNPWHSWMRLSGFDFFADPDLAAVCTWMGDVWVVSGINRQPLDELRWRRIATGLFQPLGLKVVDDIIYVTCRDQIARLRDLNADGEIDFIECFNNDQQVTGHFHEFAMGLQTDAAGNFYYTKGARHGLPAVVPQHGTLLRVSPDGRKTDILATGFRAPNGVCVNPDGTFFVTDQEGFWVPKNRIDLVRGEGPSEFFGNMWAYTDLTDPSDAAMRQPLCWITNSFDRSPAEPLWVPQDSAWTTLRGSLLNLSYGYGKLYTVPFEAVGDIVQGGVSPLLMPPFPTGVMRGRFHPQNGQLYACGLFAWAGNQTQPGGFYRVRTTGLPAWQPVGLRFREGQIQVDFSDPLPPGVEDPGHYHVKSWQLRRSAEYGSPHLNEKSLSVSGVKVTGDRTLIIQVPELAPTMGLELVCELPMADGRTRERVIHGTVHRLNP